MKGDQELILVADRLDFVVGVEDFALVQTQRFDDVLIRVGVDCFLERLAQQELAAFRCCDVAVGAQHNVVGGQRIGGDEEAQVALDDAALVFGQTVGVFPQRDVARHVHFLGHPVIGAGGQVLFPRPLVLEGHQLVDVGLTIDDALVSGIDAAVRCGDDGSGGGACCWGRGVHWLQRRCLERQRRLSHQAVVGQTAVQLILR